MAGEEAPLRARQSITKTLESAPKQGGPKDAMHWSTRSMAREAGLTQTAVHDIWRAFGRARKAGPIGVMLR